jgi:pilus assembly protein Flp/PilA
MKSESVERGRFEAACQGTFIFPELRLPNLLQTENAMIRRFWNDETGATAIEYGLIVAIVVVGTIGAIQALGTDIKAKFQLVADNPAWD